MYRISITGPESTGKSALAKELAAHFGTVWVPEYAREYLEKLGRRYEFEDIAIIAIGQLEQENRMAAKADQIVFCDTDMLVCKIWSEFRYGHCDAWLQKIVRSHVYDLYLLCDIDLPWEEDPLRENPKERQELFDIYLRELQKMNANFGIVTGTGDQRLRNAISAVVGRLSW
ncbi:MAG TPA: ATP-binding protein [Bacteroidales bacterium]|nr:ATP-binding protein [Bacteroidales bacterium]HPI86501.1 ATP-binding protein [Bacteroidales bacterium]HPM93729.1 ATP-binding protein [Bacteroidales bacterium]